MRRSFPQFRIVLALLVASLAQTQTDGSIFVQGQIERNGDITTLTVDSDHSNIMIANPEVVRAEKNREVVLHAVSTKDGIRVISSASIDDQNKPDDFSFAANVAEHKDAAMVERLLQLGANPNAKTRDGIPVLIAAMHMGDQSLMLARGFDPNVEITTLLLDHGASPDALNKNWQTPLMAAACFGDEKLIKLFIDYKANVNIGNRFGMTALMYARSFVKVRMLIAAGASVNDRNTTGETALYYSTQRADPDAVKVLIEAGANVNAKNDKNISPLHLAQLELAADRFSKQGRGPEHERQVQSVIDLLLAAGALPDPQ
jgi:ankyrin repeat protein